MSHYHSRIGQSSVSGLIPGPERLRRCGGILDRCVTGSQAFASMIFRSRRRVRQLRALDPAQLLDHSEDETPSATVASLCPEERRLFIALLRGERTSSPSRRV